MLFSVVDLTFEEAALYLYNAGHPLVAFWLLDECREFYGATAAADEEPQEGQQEGASVRPEPGEEETELFLDLRDPKSSLGLSLERLCERGSDFLLAIPKEEGA